MGMMSWQSRLFVIKRKRKKEKSIKESLDTKILNQPASTHYLLFSQALSSLFRPFRQKSACSTCKLVLFALLHFAADHQPEEKIIAYSMAIYEFKQDHRYTFGVKGLGKITALRDSSVVVTSQSDDPDYQHWVVHIDGRTGPGLHNVGLLKQSGQTHYLTSTSIVLDALATTQTNATSVEFSGDLKGYSFYITSSVSPVEVINVEGVSKLEVVSSSSAKFEIVDITQ